MSVSSRIYRWYGIAARFRKQRRKSTFRLEPLESRSLMATFVDLGPVSVTAINSSAQVIGAPAGGFISPGGPPFLRDSNGVVHTINPLPGYGAVQLAGLNDAGEVVGSLFTGLGGMGGVGDRAFLYSQGTMTNLGVLGGDSSGATAINSSGLVVGVSSTSSGAGNAFLWSQATGMQDLTSEGFVGSPTGINNSGQIVGDNGPYGGGLGEPNVQSVLWNGPGNLIYLPTFGGSNVRATALNDSGEVVGGSTTSTSLSTPVHAFSWSQGQPMKDLGTLSGIPSSYATAINTSGVVVGYAFTGSGFEGGRAFIYEHGQMTDLNSIPGIPPDGS
jgi:probable HAF family extracellular repeat protein